MRVGQDPVLKLPNEDFEPELKRKITDHGSPFEKSEFGVYLPNGSRLTWWDVVEGRRTDLAQYAWRDIAAILHEGTGAQGLNPRTQAQPPRFGDALSKQLLMRGLHKLNDPAFATRLIDNVLNVNMRHRLGSLHKGAIEPLAIELHRLVPLDYNPSRDDVEALWAPIVVDTLLTLLANAGPTLHEVRACYGPAAAQMCQVLLDAARPDEVRDGHVGLTDLQAALAAPACSLLLARLAEDVKGRLVQMQSRGVQSFHVNRKDAQHPSPLVEALAKKFLGSEAVLHRDIVGALPRALVDLVAPLAKGDSVALAHIEQALGSDATDALRSATLLVSSNRTPEEMREATWMSNTGPGYIPAESKLGELLRSPEASQVFAERHHQYAPTVSLDALLSLLLVGDPSLWPLQQVLREGGANGILSRLHALITPQEFRSAQTFFEQLHAFVNQQSSEATANRALLPQALVEAFAQVADAKGGVSIKAACAVYGDFGGRLLAHLSTQIKSETPRVRNVHRLTGLSDATIALLGRSMSDRSFAHRMPLLAKAAAQKGKHNSFVGFSATVLQHLFPPTVLDALEELGLAPAQTRVIGKAYSTHPDRYAALLGKGRIVDESSRHTHNAVEQDASARIAQAAQTQLRGMFADVTADEIAYRNTAPRFLLIDEGGKLIETLHSAEFSKYAHLVVAVEHTDRGIQVIETMRSQGVNLLCPVINMARSVAKKQIESPAIGESVVFHTLHELDAMGVAPTEKSAAVIGYGAVGKFTAEALRRRGYAVTIYDKDVQKMRDAIADGFSAEPDIPLDQARINALAGAHLLISATGTTTLTLDEYDLLPNRAILVNAASGNHELGIGGTPKEILADRTAPETVREDGRASMRFGEQDIVCGEYYAPEAHRHLVMRSQSGKEHLVLRGGAVINMTLGMPPEYAQLTLSLVLLSALQARALAMLPYQDRPRSLVELAEDTEAFLREDFNKALKDAGLPPASAPDFTRVPIWG